MIAEKKHKPIIKKVTVSDFKAHCTEYIRSLEDSDEIIEITRHGKVVALMQKPEEPEQAGTIENFMGGLRGTVIFSADYDPHAPAWDEDDWEMNKE